MKPKQKNLDIYNKYFSTFSFASAGEMSGCIKLMIDGLGKFDKETVIIAAIDACISECSTELYEMLVYEFGINPNIFEMRMKVRTYKTQKILDFLREVRLGSLLS